MIKRLLSVSVAIGLALSAILASCASREEKRDDVGAPEGFADANDHDGAQASDTAGGIGAQWREAAIAPQAGGLGMIRFDGMGPVQLMEKALAEKDEQTMRVVLFNALSLDYVMPDGRSIRQSILDTGDAQCIKLIEEAENFKLDPSILR